MKSLILIILVSTFSTAAITIALASKSGASGSESTASSSKSNSAPGSASASASTSNSSPKSKDKLSKQKEQAKLIERGRRLYNANNCKSCHSTDKRGGTYGPALDKLGKHANQLQLSEEIHGGADEPEMDFKTRHLTRDDQRAIIEYLLSIQKK
ncbi:MAG TPA: cytochrome c [Drouetiella sp.]